MHHKNGTWLVLGVSGISFAIEFLIFFSFVITPDFCSFSVPLPLLYSTHYINIIEFHANRSLCHVDKSILGVHGINDLIMRSLMMVCREREREMAREKKRSIEDPCAQSIFRNMVIASDFISFSLARSPSDEMPRCLCTIWYAWLLFRRSV